MANATYILSLQSGWVSAAIARHAGEVKDKSNCQLSDPPRIKVLPAFLSGTASFDGTPMSPKMRSIYAALHLQKIRRTQPDQEVTS